MENKWWKLIVGVILVIFALWLAYHGGQMLA